ncbi:hypothetical protein G7Z17_g4111 [Cylindrodendrum hubeiense]|uniref:Uncharacterized protein n=1 Tax=Cylindrodendrum hubeiense TaxID=595255 RepID=A0A9P5HGM5_9HYPO|nr:hypothetical protein G7Z17_g4111 [Cylindrodendrum hubeiense]
MVDSSNTEHSGAINSARGNLPAGETGIDHILQIPWDQVYSISHNGTYKTPVALRGTPINKIDENGPYWEQSWASLDKYLEREHAEEVLKNEFHERLLRSPNDGYLAKQHKRHQDNVSKQKKIREIFGRDSPYHPNQLVSKHHLPSGGLCHQELMYKLACKISDLRFLHKKGDITMDPWDFLRWRIARKAQSLVGSTWQSTRDVIKTVATRICDDSHEGQAADKYKDRVLRMAVLRSAQQQHQINRYKSKDTAKPAGIQKTTRQVPQSTINPRPRPRPRPVGSSLPANRSLNSSTTSSTAATREQQQRRERLARPSEYQGVNAFRAQQRSRP